MLFTLILLSFSMIFVIFKALVTSAILVVVLIILGTYTACIATNTKNHNVRFRLKPKYFLHNLGGGGGFEYSSAK